MADGRCRMDESGDATISGKILPHAAQMVHYKSERGKIHLLETTNFKEFNDITQTQSRTTVSMVCANSNEAEHPQSTGLCVASSPAWNPEEPVQE